MSNVTISKKEYERLQDSELFLQCLESAGVDSWEGFEQALEVFQEES